MSDAHLTGSLKVLREQYRASGTFYTPPELVEFMRSLIPGNPANGGSGTKATPGAVHEVEGPIHACEYGLHIETEDFARWRGERWWVAALIGEVQMYDTKVVGTKRIILEELEAVA